MAITKYQIFLASRFEEFAELRRVLKDKLNRLKNPPIEVMDLNDNAADPNPPLARCYSAIDNAELLVLLLGQTYGEPPYKQQQSYTELEYRHALSNGKPILPFLISNTANFVSNSSQSRDPKLVKWIAEIEKQHTLSNLDANVDLDQLANAIFEQVRERFVELYSNFDLTIPNEADDEGELDEAIIKRERLATAPMQSPEEMSTKSLLKAFANDHAKEALKALELGLPQIAVHHLQKAIDMVPLDVVLGYWLSRLLVATGRHRSCIEGRRIAHRCAQVAAMVEEQKLEAMACQIVAARASERIGELEVALEYVRRAHETVPYHWLVKFEYGRQLALAQESDQALSFAEEAFWLQPYTILRVQTDSAFRGLGKAFHDFRAQLRQTVERETAEVARLEKLIREFSSNLGIVSAEAPVLPALTSTIDRKQPIIELVRNANRSVKTSLQLLQLCASRLSAENDGFTFNSDRGLTPEVKSHIQERIATEESKVASFSRERNEAGHRQAELRKQKLLVLAAGSLVSIFLFAIAGITLYLAASEIAVLGLLLALMGVLGTWAISRAIGSGLTPLQQRLDRSDIQLQQAKKSLTVLMTTEQDFEARELRLRSNLEAFSNFVRQFESIGLKRIPFSPARPIDRKGADDLVRVDPTKILSLGLTADSKLFPAQLRSSSLSAEPSTRHWLARRVRSGATETWSRSAAYFHPVKINSLYVHKDGQQTGPFTVAQIKASLQAGQLSTNDYVWYEGISDSIRLSSVPGIVY